MKSTIVILGLGTLGGRLLDMLVRFPHKIDVVVAGRNLSKTSERMNLSTLVANQLGYYPTVRIVKIDLMNIDETSTELARIKPDIIFNATSLMSYWVPSVKLPDTVWKRLYYAYTGWQLPLHLTLTHHLMESVKHACPSARVVNASYPDAVNAVLEKVGMAPELGIGNVSNVVPGIRRAVAITIGVPVERVTIRLVAHHHFSYRVPTTGDTNLPFLLQIYVDGQTFSDAVVVGQAFRLLRDQLKRTRGIDGIIMTAASAMQVLLAMLNERDQVVHAPGIHGLPGGYPVWVSNTGSRLALPQGVLLEDALQVNLRGQVLDGIAEIDTTGTVRFSEQEMEVVKEIIGYHCLKMPLHESASRAMEVIARFDEAIERLNKTA